MTNKPRIIGTTWETAVVNYLSEAPYLDPKRTGSADYGAADIHFADDWTIEAKAEVKIDLPGYLKQLRESVARSGRSPIKSSVWVKNRRHSTSQAYVVVSGENYRALAVYVGALEGMLELAVSPEMLAAIARDLNA